MVSPRKLVASASPHRKLVEQIEAEQRRYLEALGWQFSHGTLGWYLTWEKTTPKGLRLIQLTLDGAFQMEAALQEVFAIGKEL